MSPCATARHAPRAPLVGAELPQHDAVLGVLETQTLGFPSVPPPVRVKALRNAVAPVNISVDVVTRVSSQHSGVGGG